MLKARIRFIVIECLEYASPVGSGCLVRAPFGLLEVFVILQYYVASSWPPSAL